MTELSTRMMRYAARLDADQARRRLGKKWQLRPPKRLANHSLAGASMPWTWKTLVIKRPNDPSIA